MSEKISNGVNSKLLQDNKKKLLDERTRLQAILKKDTVLDSEIPGGYRPKFEELGTEDSENAQESEKFGNDLSIAEDLDARLLKVQAAIKRIEDNTYGKCQIGGEEIDEARLRVEPAAETCVAHAK